MSQDEKTDGQASLWALPAQRAREAFEAARLNDDADGWEAAMEAAYPSMRDEYVRLSIERDDARGERDQASASYQQVTAERDGLLANNLEIARQNVAVTAERDRLAEQADRFSRQLAAAVRGLKRIAAARNVTGAVAAQTLEAIGDVQPQPVADGPQGHDSGRKSPSAADDTDDIPEAAEGLSEPREWAPRDVSEMRMKRGQPPVRGGAS